MLAAGEAAGRTSREDTLGHGMKLLVAGRYRQAEIQLRQAVAEDPRSADPLLEGLRALLPPNNVTVPRLEGWAFLISKKPDEARVKLSCQDFES